MASFEPQDDFDYLDAPPRPTTPPIRRGFVVVFGLLAIAATLVYGIPYLSEQIGYSYEVGRSRASIEALAKLEKGGLIQGASNLFRIASNAVAPAVVHISTQRRAKLDGDRIGEMLVPLEVGSGVVIDKVNGYIVTNNHVIRDPEQGLASSINVRIGRGTEMPARIVGTDPKTDLAVLQVRGDIRVAAEWGDAETLDIGDWVLAIGSPFNLDQTVTAGIVSATGRSNLRLGGEDAYEDFIQTDASINPGNSGGPLIGLDGKVIGINTAIYSENGSNQGIGLAISSTMARRVVDQIIKSGKAVRGYLGVRIQSITPALAREFNLPEPRGVLVEGVQPGSPAESVGLKAGDVLVRLGGKPVDDQSALRNRAASLEIGAKTAVEFYRDGKKQSLDVVIAEQPDSRPGLLSLGFTVQDITAEQSGGHPGTYIVAVAPGSPAAAANLLPGLQIVGVGRQPIKSKAEFDLFSAKYDLTQGLPLQIRGPKGQPVFVTVGGPDGDGRR
ncbi:trypsin-like peptidase domain-containing protein [Isosphaeraceae bacterium EP7]